MAETVTANGRDVATQGTGHVAFTDGPPEKLLIQGKPQEFINYAYTKDALLSTATKTFYKSCPIWTETGKLLPSKDIPAAPVGPGVPSGTTFALISPAEASSDVIVEEHGVVRYNDKTHHNNNNQDGHVLTEAEFLAAVDKFLKDRAAKALEDEKKKPGAGDGPDAGRDPDEDDADQDGKDDKEKEDKEATEDCELEEVEIECQHEGRKAGEQKLLEVVPKNFSDTITITAKDIKNVCEKHVSWQIGGYYTSTKKGPKVTFEATCWGNEIAAGAAVGGKLGAAAAILAMIAAPSHDYSVVGTACTGAQNNVKYMVKAFPGVEAALVFENVIEKFEKPAEEFTTWLNSKLHAGITIEGPSGSGSIKAGWGEEDKNYRAYCKLSAEGGFDPLIKISKDFELPLPFGLNYISDLLEFFDLGSLKLLLTISGKLFVSMAIFIKMRVNQVGGEGTFGGALGLDIGPKLTVGPDLASAWGTIGGSAGLKASISGTTKPEIKGEITAFCGQLGGEIGVKVGRLSKKGQCTVYQGGEKKLGERTFFP